MKNLLAAFICLLLTLPCSAEIIIVDDDWPYDFDNIAEAIDYSENWDTIFVFPGTYTADGSRGIDFRGKAITVRSVFPEDPDIVSITIIDCNGTSRGFYFNSGEDANSVIDGLTITNGFDFSGGGIYLSESSPTSERKTESEGKNEEVNFDTNDSHNIPVRLRAGNRRLLQRSSHGWWSSPN